MAVSAAQVSRVEAAQQGFKQILVDITTDTSYPAGGYTLDWSALLTATQTTTVLGFLVLGLTGTTGMGKAIRFTDCDNRTAMKLRIYLAGTAGSDLNEVATSSDQSTTGPIRGFLICT